MARKPPTRGARKLEAALERFELAPRVAGARALDVGASTGGFTGCLLAYGAREVTAVDVGHGQLDAELRADPRVRSLERTDFRRAPLHVAEGPFDFFTVDVSFMAARNVLRALAFRLQPGAQGVVLLKPQFELPTKQIERGDVSDPALRERALQRFTSRAAELGFELLGRMDSAVPGGSGTVEMPLWLRFLGRPSHLPAKGERRARARAARQPSHTQPAAHAKTERSQVGHALSLSWFAAATPGLEAALAEELRELLPSGARALREVPGGVELDGPLATGLAVNLGSRIASRVLVRVGQARARDAAELRRRLRALPFEALLRADLPVHVAVTTHRCRLFHTRAIAENVLLAAADRLGCALREQRTIAGDTGDPPEGDAPLDASAEALEPFTRVLVRGEDDRFTVSVDSSGPLLHKRGYRAEAGRAPLRETLAAGVLRLCGYDGRGPLVNAMCGAGTLAIEAAFVALGRAPGLDRRFALERFPCFDPALDRELREAARQRAQERTAAEVIGFDRDRASIERARRNADRAGLSSHVRFEHADVSAFLPPAAAGLVVANPPYGQRLGDRGSARAAWQSLAQVLHARYRGYRVGLLLPRGAPTRELRLPNVEQHALRNGGLPVTLLVAHM